jgi:serine protease Do
VTSGTPAANAGLQRGDVILDVDGEKLDDPNQLRMHISMMSPGTTVNMHVLHDSAEKTVAVKLAEMPANLAKSGPAAENDSEHGATSALEGVQVDTAKGKGVLVTDVEPGSPAASAGLREGDLILEVNRKEVAGVNDFDRALRNGNKDTILLLVKRGENTLYMAVQNS